MNEWKKLSESEFKMKMNTTWHTTHPDNVNTEIGDESDDAIDLLRQAVREFHWLCRPEMAAPIESFLKNRDKM